MCAEACACPAALDAITFVFVAYLWHAYPEAAAKRVAPKKLLTPTGHFGACSAMCPAMRVTKNLDPLLPVAAPIILGCPRRLTSATNL